MFNELVPCFTLLKKRSENSFSKIECMNETMRLSWLNPIDVGSAKQSVAFEEMRVREARQKIERDKRLEEIDQKYNDEYIKNVYKAAASTSIFPPTPMRNMII